MGPHTMTIREETRRTSLDLLSSKTNIVPWKTLWGKTIFSLGLQESEAHFSHEGLSLIFPAQVQQLLLQEKPCSLLPRFVFICWARQSTMCTRAGGERKRKKKQQPLFTLPPRRRRRRRRRRPKAEEGEGVRKNGLQRRRKGGKGLETKAPPFALRLLDRGSKLPDRKEDGGEETEGAGIISLSSLAP